MPYFQFLIDPNETGKEFWDPYPPIEAKDEIAAVDLWFAGRYEYGGSEILDTRRTDKKGDPINESRRMKPFAEFVTENLAHARRYLEAQVKEFHRIAGERAKQSLRRPSMSRDDRLMRLNDELKTAQYSFRRVYGGVLKDFGSKAGVRELTMIKNRMSKERQLKEFREFITEARWERVQVDSNRGTGFTNADEPDDFYYHVTLEPAAKKIISSGKLIPAKPLMGRGGFASNSKGRVFLTDRNGVFFWMSRCEDHAFDAYDDPPEVVVLRIPKSAVPTATPDDVGSRDAHAPAYYVSGGFSV